MAANDYYQGSEPPRTYTASPASRYDPRHAPSPAATPAPSYRTTATASQPPYPGQYGASPAPYSSSAYQGHSQSQQTGASPFETIFDDHVYPMNSRTDLAGANSGDMSQQAYYPSDTGYYGQNRPVPASSTDIPLQDRPGKDAVSPIEPDVNDHVYDDPNGGRSRRRKKPQKVAFGQLGMFGSDKKRIPWVTYIFTIAQAAVFIAEIARNAVLTGSPIMTKPQFNYFIGPSPQVMINMGARYTLCMHNVEEIQGSEIQIGFPCPNATDFNAEDQFCPLSTLCGFGGVPDPEFNGDEDQSPEPNQWWRFIIPVFMHAGLVHIAFNFLLQLTLGREMEQAVGPVRYFLVYMSAGIFGFIMGGNFDQPASPSTGASGALFGVIALVLLDLLYSWSDRRNPVKDLIFVIVVIVISFVLGLLPGMDNFAHIGGFLMGLLLGVCVLHSPNSLRKKIGQDASYEAVSGGTVPGQQPFLKNPGGFFKGRKPLWWVWWLVRVGALVLTLVVFIVLLNNFYTTEYDCSWCKYLSCIPVNDWCDMGAIRLEEVN